MQFLNKTNIFLFILFIFFQNSLAQDKRLRDYDIKIGILNPGKNNAITDVSDVRVGHITLIEGDSVRTGVTAILPHSGNIFQKKVPAAIYIGNGFGKLAGYSQVRELGNIETPIILTNTLSVPVAADALISYVLELPDNEMVRSVNPVVGETNDGRLNDIRGRHIKPVHIFDAIQNAKSGVMDEGNIGAGTGTVCFGYKGGIGTSSRILPQKNGGYTVGVLVQTNFGGVLEIAGVPIARELNTAPQIQYDGDGSCMIVVITDAPLDARNLERLAKRAMLGLAKTGGIASNGSGDYVIALSTAKENLIPYSGSGKVYPGGVLRNDQMTLLFLATVEATEEAILNSLFAARTMQGVNGKIVEELPTNQVIEIMKRYHRGKKE